MFGSYQPHRGRNAMYLTLLAPSRSWKHTKALWHRQLMARPELKFSLKSRKSKRKLYNGIVTWQWTAEASAKGFLPFFILYPSSFTSICNPWQTLSVFPYKIHTGFCTLFFHFCFIFPLWKTATFFGLSLPEIIQTDIHLLGRFSPLMLTPSLLPLLSRLLLFRSKILTTSTDITLPPSFGTEEIIAG